MERALTDISIILAKTKGGLAAVAHAGGMAVIAGTETKFDTLTTYSDPPSTAAGHIDTNQPGWVAFAQ